MQRLEVFADITCPFTHVGLKKVLQQLEAASSTVEVIVRAWPLEWVNGSGLAAGPVAEKVAVLRHDLGVADFDGFRAETWPDTTIPALNLASAAYEQDAATGLRVSVALRAALFEEGQDISDPEVLESVATSCGLSDRSTRSTTISPTNGATPAVEADYAEGQRRGVRGSPDFWVGSEEFFCPSLSLSHTEAGALNAEFDGAGLAEFVARIA